MTAAAPAVNASDFVEGSVSMELAELAVVPITCLKDNPASFLADLLVDLIGEIFVKGELDGVSLVPQGVALILGLEGVSDMSAAMSHPRRCA